MAVYIAGFVVCAVVACAAGAEAAGWLSTRLLAKRRMTSAAWVFGASGAFFAAAAALVAMGHQPWIPGLAGLVCVLSADQMIRLQTKKPSGAPAPASATAAAAQGEEQN